MDARVYLVCDHVLKKVFFVKQLAVPSSIPSRDICGHSDKGTKAATRARTRRPASSSVLRNPFIHRRQGEDQDRRCRRRWWGHRHRQQHHGRLSRCRTTSSRTQRRRIRRSSIRCTGIWSSSLRSTSWSSRRIQRSVIWRSSARSSSWRDVRCSPGTSGKLRCSACSWGVWVCWSRTQRKGC